MGPSKNYVTKRNVSVLPPVLRNESLSYRPPLPPPRSTFSLTHAIVLDMPKHINKHAHIQMRSIKDILIH